MLSMRASSLVLAVSTMAAACSSSGENHMPPGSGADARPDDPFGEDGGSDSDTNPRFGTPPLPDGLSRGWVYVRTHAPFVTGLTVSTAPTGAAAVLRYFDDFNASAVHLWATGAPNEVASWQVAGTRDWVSWVDEDGKSAANGQILGGLPPDSPGRIGFQVGDEPRDMATLDRMGAGIAAVRQADPGALAWMNFCCETEIDVEAFTDRAVATYGADLISYDRYDRKEGGYVALERWRDAAIKNGVPYWRYMKGYLEKNEVLDDIHPSDLRWDAFSGALYGYTGHTWFIYQITPVPDMAPAFHTTFDLMSAPTTLFAPAADINRRLVNVGESLSQLTSVDVRYVASLAFLQPDETETWEHGAGGDPFITAVKPADGQGFLDIGIGFFVDDAGERYFAIQNPRHTHGAFPNASDTAGVITVAFDFSGSDVNRERLLSVDDSNGDLVEVPLETSGANKALLEVTLEAGELRLYKYDTGAPFARRAGTY